MQQAIICINSDMRRRINRLAHARAQRYALDEAARLVVELEALAATGANLDALNAHLDAAERGIEGRRV